MSRVAVFATSVALLLGLLIPSVSTAASCCALTTEGVVTSRVAVIGDSYTNGTAIGGQGPNAWPVLAFRTLSRQGFDVTDDVAAEGRAGYGVRGDQGNLFQDLTLRAVHPDDRLVVFFGSRNDQDVPPPVLAQQVREAFGTAHRIAPLARMLVIGPPWPTPNPPPAILTIRDILNSTARSFGATFVDPLAAGWFLDDPQIIGSDGVHPTDAGHVYLANRIAPIISGMLPRKI